MLTSNHVQAKTCSAEFSIGFLLSLTYLEWAKSLSVSVFISSYKCKTSSKKAGNFYSFDADMTKTIVSMNLQFG